LLRLRSHPPVPTLFPYTTLFRSYSPAQRVYLDQWEQGAYNAYAGGLLFAPLLARYQFIPTLSRIITTATHEGYSLAELALTLIRSEEHTSELQSRGHLVCRLLLE